MIKTRSAGEAKGHAALEGRLRQALMGEALPEGLADRLFEKLSAGPLAQTASEPVRRGAFWPAGHDLSPGALAACVGAAMVIVYLFVVERLMLPPGL